MIIIDWMVIAFVWFFSKLEVGLNVFADRADKAWDNSRRRSVNRWCRRVLHCYVEKEWPPWHDLYPERQMPIPNARRESIALKAEVYFETVFQFSSKKVTR